jgi:hypothetical protein
LTTCTALPLPLFWLVTTTDIAYTCSIATLYSVLCRYLSSMNLTAGYRVHKGTATDPSRSHVLHRIPPRVFVWHGTKSPLCLNLDQATHVLTQVQCRLVPTRDIPGSMAVPIHPRSEIGRAFHVKICNYLQTTRILHVGINLSRHHTGIASISRVARLFNFKNDGNRPSTSNVALAVVKLMR